MNKQDKEKVNQILDSNYYVTIGEKNAAYNAALQMAQWKDEQFSKFLLWLDDNFVIKRFTDGEPMTYAELIDNFKSNSHEHNTTKTD